MSWVNIKIIILLIIVIICCTSLTGYANETIQYDKYYYAVLDAKLNVRDGEEPKTIDRLYDLKKKSKNLTQQLVQLLDYYIGEGPSEVLDEMITEQGRIALPLLLNKKKKHIECLPKYKSICIDKETRDENIDLLVDAINKGKILRPDE